MVQIDARLPDLPKEEIQLTIEESNLDFEGIKNAVRAKAREISKDAMLLSWYSGKTGDYRPRTECGAGGRAPWVVFAESRGCNLVIDVNGGDYLFYFLRL